MKTTNEIRYEDALNRINDYFRTARDRHNGAVEMGSAWGVSNDLICAEIERWEQFSAKAHRHMDALTVGIKVERNIRMAPTLANSVFGRKAKTELTSEELDAINAAIDFASEC